MTEPTHPFMVWAWMALATIGGAVTSISFQPYKQMGWGQIAIAFIVSSTFSIFVGYAVADFVAVKLSGPGPVNLKVFGAVMWFMAASAHFIIPVAITRAKAFVAALGMGPTEERK